MKLVHWLSVGAVVLSSSASFGQQKDAVSAARFGISIDGYEVSVKDFVGGDVASDKPKASSTPLKITVDQTGADAMWQWIATSINQGPVEKKIEGQATGRRRATFTSAHITEVKFDDLDASGSKKPMQVTVTVVPKQIVAAAEAAKPKPAPAQKPWHAANFKVAIGGLPLTKVSKIDSLTIKQKASESGKPAFELADLRVTLSTADAKTVADTLAKDATKPLTIGLTNDDGSVWKTLTVHGLKIQPAQAAGSNGTIIIKGSKILVN